MSTFPTKLRKEEKDRTKGKTRKGQKEREWIKETILRYQNSNRIVFDETNKLLS